MLVAACLVAAVVPAIVKAVIVTPTAIFLNDRTRFTQVTLFNSGGTAEEITLAVKYGYPDVDSVGNLVYRLLDSAATSEPSAASWVTVYPRRMVLQPGARQVVRVLANPPRMLRDGEYWARFVVTSNGAALPIESDEPTVRVGVNLELKTVIPVLFRHGDVSTGLEVKGFSASLSRDSITAIADLHRLGNAAYLGSVRFELVDSTGRQRGRWQTALAIHKPDYKRRFVYPVGSTLTGGRYELRMTLVPERSDYAPANVLSAERINATAGVDLK